MKKIIIIASLLLSLSSFAQPYKACLDSGIQRWSFIGYDVGEIRSSEIAAFEDTLINGLAYRKLLDYTFPYEFQESVDSSNTIWKNYTDPLWFYWLDDFYIRESEDASKLYIYHTKYNKDYLISDLNLQAGDIFQYNPTVSVTNEAIVDSVYFKGGLKHIALYFLEPGIERNLTFIESVGPSLWYTPLAGAITGAGYYGLNCFQNQDLFYKSDRYDGAEVVPLDFNECPCGYSRNLSENKKNDISKKEVRESIANGLLSLDFEDVFSGQLSLMDVSGRMYYQKSVTNQSNYEIDISNFPKGIYILRVHSIVSTHGEYLNKKIFIY